MGSRGWSASPLVNWGLSEGQAHLSSETCQHLIFITECSLQYHPHSCWLSGTLGKIIWLFLMLSLFLLPHCGLYFVLFLNTINWKKTGRSLIIKAMFLFAIVKQRSVRYSLWVRSRPPRAFVNKVLLEHSHAHLFMSCPWLLLYHMAGLSSCGRDHIAANIHYLAFQGRKFAHLCYKTLTKTQVLHND